MAWKLRAAYRIVPFHEARQGDLDALRRWCEGEGQPPVALVHGPGGAGKTRLAVELVAELRGRGLLAGRLETEEARRASDTDLDYLLAHPRPRLVVLDYAEQSGDLVLRLLRILAVRGGRLRLLLLARVAGDWWNGLGAPDGDVQALVEGARVLRLEPLPQESRRALFERARGTFAQGPAPHASSFRQPPELEALDQPLVVTIAALAHAHGETESALATPAAVLDWLYHREVRAWRRALCLPEPPPDAETRFVERIAAVTVLRNRLPEIDEAQALAADLPERLELTGTRPEDLLRETRRAFSRLYQDRGVPQPDLLGEAVVERAWLRDPRMFELVRGSEDVGHALIVLARVALRFREAEGWLRGLLLSDPEHLFAPALEAAKRTGEPLGSILAETWPELPEGLRNALAPTLYEALPHPFRTVALRPFALLVTRHLYESTPSDDAARRAEMAHATARCLGALGRRQEALVAIGEAVAIRRRLAARNPDAFEPDLASSLNNLSVRLAALGRREEALPASEEAVALYRRLAARNPAAFEPSPANALHTMAQVLRGLGRVEEAAERAEEGLRLLLPRLRRLPAAFEKIARQLVGEYTAACTEAGREPDAELLARVDDILARLGSDRAGDGQAPTARSRRLPLPRCG